MPRETYPRIVRHGTMERKRRVKENFHVLNEVNEKLLSEKILNALHIPEASGPDQCSKYTRLAAERLFGLHYIPADAHEVGIRNKVVWDEKNKHSFPKLNPGQILGFYFPGSPFNARGWRFTHTGIVIKAQGNDYIIANNPSGEIMIETLSGFLGEVEGRRVVQVIEPKYPAGVTPEYADGELREIRTKAGKLIAEGKMHLPTGKKRD